MIKFTKRQMKTLLLALNKFYTTNMEFKRYPSDCAYQIYMNASNYLQGVLDALDIAAYEDTTGSYPERFHIYPLEVFNGCRDDYNNRIEIMTIDAFTKTIIYDIFKETDTYSVKYAKQLQEGLARYYKENYGEQLILP